MKEITNWILVILIALLISIIIIGGFITYVFDSFEKATTPITELDKYPKVISKLKESPSEIVKHFPYEIPTNATEREFYYFGGFLQADAKIQLKFKSTSEDVNLYYEESYKNATRIRHIDKCVFESYKSTDDQSLSPDGVFEEMCFHPDPNNTPEHSPKYGVVINKKDKIIIFWARFVY